MVRTMEIGVKTVTVGEGDWPHTEYNKDNWEFMSKRQNGGVSGWKSTKRRRQGWRGFFLN